MTQIPPIVGAGFDLSSTKTGVTIGGVAPPRSFAWRPTGPRDVGSILDEYMSWLWQTIKMFNIGIVGLEAAAMGGKGIIMDARTAEILISMGGCTKAICHGAGIPYHSAAVSTIRKHFLGTGRPANGKRDVMDRCKLLNWPVHNTDEADSAAVWAWLMATHVPGFRYESTTPLLGRSFP